MYEENELTITPNAISKSFSVYCSYKNSKTTDSGRWYDFNLLPKAFEINENKKMLSYFIPEFEEEDMCGTFTAIMKIYFTDDGFKKITDILNYNFPQ